MGSDQVRFLQALLQRSFNVSQLRQGDSCLKLFARASQ